MHFWAASSFAVTRSARKLAPLWQMAMVCLIWVAIGILLSCSYNETPPLLSGITLQAQHHDIRFVLADLDGDRKPDLALVETQGGRAANTSYSIHIKLSAGAESAIGLKGPMGGLRVAARDVNGDDYLDLVVTSNLDVHFIQVLLNDGRGNFSAAQPSEYARLQTEDTGALDGPVGPQADRTTLLPLRLFPDDGVAQACSYSQVLSSDSCPRPEIVHLWEHTARLRPGRAPPSSVALS